MLSITHMEKGSSVFDNMLITVTLAIASLRCKIKNGWNFTAYRLLKEIRSGNMESGGFRRWRGTRDNEEYDEGGASKV